jgi:hypothetical protein
MLSQGTVPLACRQGWLCPEHTGPVRLDGAYGITGKTSNTAKTARTAKNDAEKL